MTGPSRAWSAPIDYAEIRRVYQSVRAGLAAALATIGTLGIIWGVPGSAYYVVPPLVALAHALYRMLRPGPRPFSSLLVDVTFVAAMMLAVGRIPQAELVLVAYVVTGAVLLLGLQEAALLAAYSAALGTAVFLFAPVTDSVMADSERGITMGRLAGLVFLLVIAALLLGASRVIKMVRIRQTAALAAEQRAGRLKDEFVSMVSHEFRTPLTSIVGFVEMLKDGREVLSDEETDEFLDIIHNEARHLSHLVEDVLVIPRLESGRLPFEFEDLDLRKAAQQAVDMVYPHTSADEAGVAVPGGIMVRADRRRLVQILRNLLENAKKYGGDQVLVEGNRNGRLYAVVVTDNGPGIPEEHHERIFEAFEQVTSGDARTDTGMGLGLPIARRLVEAMDGTLTYESRFPTGSRFCFTLPLAAPSGEMEPVAARSV